MPGVLSRLADWSNSPSSMFVSLFGAYVVYRVLRSIFQHRAAVSQLARIQSKKNAERNGEFAAARSALSETADERLKAGKQNEILALKAYEVVKAVAAGKLSARLALHALLDRALFLQEKNLALSEVCFKDALTQAEELDRQQAKNKTTVGRLHGLPISLKDSVGVKGLDTTLGLTRFASQPYTEDALIVQLLKKQGAIIYAKSNIPQTLLSFECSNPLWGRSTNPYNPAFTPGGSSGGESVLLAGRGSFVGIGTDIGGSVRIPAHFCGNYALKPTGKRLSLQGFRPSVPGQEAVTAVAGPMANSVEDLALVLRELFVPEAWERDSDLVPLPFDEKAYQATGKLKIGYYVDDGFVPPSPACARGVLEAVEALRQAGHEVVEFKPPRTCDGIELYFKLMTSDYCNTIDAQLQGEIREDYVKALVTAVRLPPRLKDALSWFVGNILGDKKTGMFLGASRERSVSQVWALQALKKKFKAEWFDAVKAQGLDAVITPAHVLPAVSHYSFKKISFTCSYTLLFNVLDFPAGIVPVTTVKSSDVYTTKPSSILEKTARSYYDPVKQAGLPIGVQVAGLGFQDETVLRVMKTLEALIPFDVKPPGI